MSLGQEILLGPFARFRSSKLGALLLLALIVLLTITTQIGGLLLWGLLPALRRLFGALRPVGAWVAWGGTLAGFAAAYLAVSLFLVPPVAAFFGREALPCFASVERPYGAASAGYCLANRHYAVAPVHRVLTDLSRYLAERFPGTELTYLDAGFPFLNGFPLPPHLSHHDGHKVDLAFFYLAEPDATPIPGGAAWPLGYWAYSGPNRGEATPCADFDGWLTLRWDFDWLQSVFSDKTLDHRRTRAMVAWLTKNGASRGVEKILLEPHLEQRLELESALIRFQGCRAARHDDHLHLQIGK